MHYFLWFILLFNTIDYEFLDKEVTDKYKYISLKKNKIENKKALEKFYEKLRTIKSTKTGKLSIVHIGDSHIQADMFSGKVRRLFQTHFGNGGRGLVFPYSIAKTNTTALVKFETDIEWNITKLIERKPDLDVGICGISIKSKETLGQIDVIVQNEEKIDYSFNKLTLFHEKNTNPLSIHIVIPNKFEEDEEEIVEFPLQTTDYSTTYKFDYNLENIIIRFFDEANLFQLDGLYFENNESGIIYNSIGVNSATFDHYLNKEKLIKQIASLNPDLIIISLGTNDSYNKEVDKTKFLTTLSKFITTIKENNENAELLFTIPADNSIKKTTTHYKFVKNKKGKKVKQAYTKVSIKNNDQVPVVKDVLIDYALKNNIAYWDFYTVMGGKNSMAKWVKDSIANTDHIHFKRDGYLLKGKLLFDAIMKGLEKNGSKRN